MGYRVALGLDLDTWNSAAECRFRHGILTTKEDATFNRVRATAIFSTDDPDRVLTDMREDGWDVADFKWINISKE